MPITDVPPVQSLRDFQGTVYAYQRFRGWHPAPPRRSWWQVITAWIVVERRSLIREER